MADISKINAVLLANIAEIDDVLAANIAKVNGLVFSTAPAFTGLLDTYTGAAAAYSTRRLYGQYTGAALRVREDSGDTETDIGFDSNGDLDTAAIATHCGSANGYVTKWYGQESSGGTGSGLDTAQTTASRQPQIYNGTAVITHNGKPAVDFAGNTIFLSASSTINLGTEDHLVTGVVTVEASSSNRVWFEEHSSSTRYVLWRQASNDTLQLYHNTVIGSGIASTDGDQYLITATRVGTTSTLYKDGGNSISGTAADFTSSGTIKIGIDQLNQGNQSWEGVIQEIVVWDTNQSSNRSGIEGNQNAHFEIGNFGTPTSGLLYDYSGAAAAYSVRQLANTAALAMRIREDGTDTETDIGFDSNGDLDTAAIASHCGSNNGYVVTWYDQAGSQLDATQGTSGSQPQIYNGTAVIIENGKPIITSTVDATLDYPLGNNAQQVFGVFKATQAQTNQAILGSSNDAYLLLMTTQGSSSELRFSRVTTRDNGAAYTGTTRNDARLAFADQTLLYCDYTTTATNGDMHFGFDINFVMTDIQEVIIYPDTATHTVADVEDAINTYFSIY